MVDLSKPASQMTSGAIAWLKTQAWGDIARRAASAAGLSPRFFRLWRRPELARKTITGIARWPAGADSRRRPRRASRCSSRRRSEFSPGLVPKHREDQHQRPSSVATRSGNRMRPRIYRGLTRDAREGWRPLGDSNPCFRRERGVKLDFRGQRRILSSCPNTHNSVLDCPALSGYIYWEKFWGHPRKTRPAMRIDAPVVPPGEPAGVRRRLDPA